VLTCCGSRQCLYPNVYLMDQFSTQIRVIRPIAVDKTEVTIWCFAPKASDRQWRGSYRPGAHAAGQQHGAGSGGLNIPLGPFLATVGGKGIYTNPK
ncbi:hypothetical protein FK521_27685, partial [Klebsiella pneumoniae]|nr:hypothetical protein [Klebsiella pneumoniae]